MNLADGYKAVMEAAARAWALPEKLSVSDWADKYRIVPSKSSPEGGRWRTARTPYAAEPMNELSSMSRTQEVVIMAASQVLKTEVLINWVFETIDQDPAPMLVVQPTEKAVSDFVSQRLDPAIDAMPRIRAAIPPSRQRDSGNRRTERNYPGGVLYLGWSNSPSELSSKPIKKLALDEIDRYPVGIKDEGSPIKLAEQRTANFPRRKILKTSTPKIKGASAIDDEYQSSSRAQYWVPCPHCNEMQVLQFENLKWKKTQEDGKTKHWPHTAEYVCEHNGCIIEERFKPGMLEGGEWRHRSPEIAKRGYHINGLYSPVGLGYSWAERAQKFLEVCKDPVKLQTFVNLHLGEAYGDHAGNLQADFLKGRAEAYPLRTVMPGYLVLTLGVDVQKDRFAFHLVAWGRGERCHTVDYTEIPADPSRTDQWEVITTYRRKPVRNAFGVDMRVAMTAIDSGNGSHTNEAYKYARKYRFDNVIVVKGSSLPSRPVLNRPTKQDVRSDKGVMETNGVDLWMVGTDTAKGALFSRVDGDAAHDDKASAMVRFSTELPATFYEGMTAEVFDADTGRWTKRPGRPNEPLDTWVYAYAAAHHPRISIHTARAADWDEQERLLEPRVNDMFTQTGAPTETATTETTDARQPQEETTQPAQPAQPDPRQPVEKSFIEPLDAWIPSVPKNWI